MALRVYSEVSALFVSYTCPDVAATHSQTRGGWPFLHCRLEWFCVWLRLGSVCVYTLRLLSKPGSVVLETWVLCVT